MVRKISSPPILEVSLLILFPEKRVCSNRHTKMKWKFLFEIEHSKNINEVDSAVLNDWKPKN